MMLMIGIAILTLPTARSEWRAGRRGADVAAAPAGGPALPADGRRDRRGCAALGLLDRRRRGLGFRV